MQDSRHDSGLTLEESNANASPADAARFSPVFYPLLLAASVSVWFFAIRAPLWLDETSSYWEIAKGFWEIPARQGISFAAHAYILWAFSRVLGTGEIALRVPELLAMATAVYLLFLAAREMFDRDIAWITVVIFCLHPTVVFAAIDVRPYAFAALAITGAILCLIRLRHSQSMILAALFGASAACITYFQLLFSVILLPLLWCFIVLKIHDRKVAWRQLGIALAVFSLMLIPVISRFNLMFHVGRALVFEPPPAFGELAFTIAPLWLLFTYAVFLVISAVTEKGRKAAATLDWRILLCLSLGLFPLLVLYILSVTTPLEVFVDRYRLVAVPGLALAWGMLVSVLHSRRLRLIFCVTLVSLTLFLYQHSPYSKQHGYTWKYALQFAEKNAAADGATVVLCSDFPQSDSLPMPQGDDVKDDAMFTPLSYYKISVPVVGLPRGLNDEAKQDGGRFLRSAAHRRFLLLGYWPSSPVLEWMRENASATHEVRELATFDRVTILEFTPRR